jgi:predicted Rossmann-fold nucleotide-binding protein
MVGTGMISPEDMELVQLIDEPANVIDAIFAFYEERDIVPSESEHEPSAFL